MLSAGRLPRLRGGTGREISSPYIDKPGILTPLFHSISGVHVRIVQQLLPVPFCSVPGFIPSRFRRLCTQTYKSHSFQWCGVKLIDTQCKTVAVMVSYDSILHVCELCGHEVCREFLVNPIVVHMK